MRFNRTTIIPRTTLHRIAYQRGGRTPCMHAQCSCQRWAPTRPLPATFARWLDVGPGLRSTALWTLTVPLLGHAAGDTVCTEVLMMAGYAVAEPAREEW